MCSCLFNISFHIYLWFSSLLFISYLNCVAFLFSYCVSYFNFTLYLFMSCLIILMSFFIIILFLFLSFYFMYCHFWAQGLYSFEPIFRPILAHSCRLKTAHQGRPAIDTNKIQPHKAQMAYPHAQPNVAILPRGHVQHIHVHCIAACMSSVCLAPAGPRHANGCSFSPAHDEPDFQQVPTSPARPQFPAHSHTSCAPSRLS